MLLRYVAWLATMSLSVAIFREKTSNSKEDNTEAGQYFGGKLDDLRRFEYKDRPFRLQALLVKRGMGGKAKSSRGDGGGSSSPLQGFVYRLHARKSPQDDQSYSDYGAELSRNSNNRKSKTSSSDYQEYNDYRDYDAIDRKSSNNDKKYSSKEEQGFGSAGADDYGILSNSNDLDKLTGGKYLTDDAFNNNFNSHIIFDAKKGFGAGSTFDKSIFDPDNYFDTSESDSDYDDNVDYDDKMKTKRHKNNYGPLDTLKQSGEVDERKSNTNTGYSIDNKYGSSEYGSSDYDTKGTYGDPDDRKSRDRKSGTYTFGAEDGSKNTNTDNGKKEKTKDGVEIDHEFDFYSPIASSFDEEFKDISFGKTDFLNKNAVFGDPDTDERSVPVSQRHNLFSFDRPSKSRRFFLERFKERKPNGNLYIDFPPVRRHKTKHEGSHQARYKSHHERERDYDDEKDSLYVTKKDDEGRRNKDSSVRRSSDSKRHSDKGDMFDIYPRDKDKDVFRRGYRLAFPGAFDKLYAGYHEDVKPTKDPFIELYVKDDGRHRGSGSSSSGSSNSGNKGDGYQDVPKEQSRKYGLYSKDIYEYERGRSDRANRNFLHRKRNFFNSEYQNGRYHRDEAEMTDSDMDGASEKDNRGESSFYKDRDYYEKKENPFGKYSSKHEQDSGFGPVGYKGTFSKDPYNEERFSNSRKNDGGFNRGDFSGDNYESNSYFGGSGDMQRGEGRPKEKKEKKTHKNYCGKIDDSLCRGRNSGHYAHPSNDMCFIHCNNWGRAFVQRCPPGTAWTGLRRKSPSKINLCV